jgi:hypothetical protein
MFPWNFHTGQSDFISHYFGHRFASSNNRCFEWQYEWSVNTCGK